MAYSFPTVYQPWGHLSNFEPQAPRVPPAWDSSLPGLDPLVGCRSFDSEALKVPRRHRDPHVALGHPSAYPLPREDPKVPSFIPRGLRCQLSSCIHSTSHETRYS